MIVFGFVFILYILKLPKVQISDTQIVICGSTLSLCRSLSAFFFKFSNQSFPSVRIFIFREIVKFIYTSSSTICLYLTSKSVKLYTLYSILTLNSQWGMGGGEGTLQHSPIPLDCWNYSLTFQRSLLKR